MASDEPCPGQQYAIQAQKHIAALRRSRPGITIEIQWCPAHKGVAGNEKADEWAKVAAEEPDTHGVERLSYDYEGRTEVHAMPLPRSLAVGTGRAQGKGELATSRHRADCGQENRTNVRRHDLHRSNASMIKQKEKIPGHPQVGDFGEVGGGASVGGRPDLQEKVPYAREPEA